MADIDQIIAGGAKTNADFNFNKINQAYWEGADQAAKNAVRDAFKDGLPQTQDGQIDWPTAAKTLIQKGGFEQGVAAANLGLQQQNLQLNQNAARYDATGKEGPQQPIAGNPPSSNRSAGAVVAPPLNRGGATPNNAPQGGGTLMQVLDAQGIPNDQLGAAAASVARELGLSDPNAPINLQDPQVRNVLIPAIQRLKRQGIGQVQPPQPGDNAPQQGVQPGSTAPIVPTPVATQQVQPPAINIRPAGVQPGGPQGPTPFGNAVAAGLIPPGSDPNQYVAGLRLRAGMLPKGPAQEVIQAHLNAIDKASELTQEQRDYNASRANPGLNDFTAQRKADEAQATGTATANVKEQGQYIDQGKKAQDRLITLNTIGGIINNDKNITLGYGADTALKVKMALKQVGIDTGDLSGAQAIQKLNSVLAAESTKSISPRPAQFEFRTFLGNNPGLSLDRAGNERVIGIYSQLAKRDVDLGRLARQNRDNWDNWDGVVAQYDKQNPIKDPTTGKVITTDSVIAPGSTKASSGSTPKLEPGKTMINGHVYKGGNPNVKSNWELRT